jgi:hypothetical protein
MARRRVGGQANPTDTTAQNLRHTYPESQTLKARPILHVRSTQGFSRALHRSLHARLTENLANLYTNTLGFPMTGRMRLVHPAGARRSLTLVGGPSARRFRLW